MTASDVFLNGVFKYMSTHSVSRKDFLMDVLKVPCILGSQKVRGRAYV